MVTGTLPGRQEAEHVGPAAVGGLGVARFELPAAGGSVGQGRWVPNQRS